MPKRRRTSVTHLHTTWYAWYAQEPRWYADAPKQQRSNAKQLVAYMKLFLGEGCVIDPVAADYRDNILEFGKQAEAEVLLFLEGQGIKSRGSTAIRKHLHDLYRSGVLNNKVSRHLHLRRTAAIQDPDRQDILAPVQTE